MSNWYHPESEQDLLKIEISQKVFNLSQNKSSPDDLRYQGFKVAVHNDYILNGEEYTFWLMTKKYNNVTLAFRGEGKTDEEALNQIREQVSNFKE